LQPILLAIFFLSMFCTTLSSAASSKPADGERLLLIHATGNPLKKESATQSAVYESMIEFLTDRGYRIVDKTSAEQASIQVSATHDIDPLLNKAAAVGLNFLAEYTIHFRTSTIVKDPDKGNGALVRVSAKIVDNTGARIITAKIAEASSTGHNTEDAIEKAARAAGRKLTQLLSKGLENYIAQTGIEGRTVTMVFEGKNETLASLTSLFEKSPTVAAVREIETGGNKATFEVICKVRRDQLERDLFRLASKQGLSLQKIRSEGNRSTWKIR